MGGCVNSAQAGVVKKMPAGPVFDLDHPHIRIHAPLTGDGGVNIRLVPFGQRLPGPVPAIQIKAPLQDTGRAIQRVDFDQNRTGCVIAMGCHERRNIGQPQAGKIGIHPEPAGEARGHARTLPCGQTSDAVPTKCMAQQARVARNILQSLNLSIIWRTLFIIS